MLTLLLNELAQAQDQIILVLDDYHAISAQPIHDSVSFVLEHLPGSLHLVILTRADPPLGLARLRARGQLVEIRAADLRFTPVETAEFLRTTMQLSLSDSEVLQIGTRTEGWAAGLQLAALSLKREAHPGQFIAAFTGSHRFVLDFLSEEVISRQPTAVQEFLLYTSVLDRLTGPLCDAVTNRLGSAEMLARLEREDLFLVPIDPQGVWFRYHHLFADVLRARLRQVHPDLEKVLHGRAAEWYERNGFIREAIPHAAAAGDADRAARLLERWAPDLLGGGETATLIHQIEALPEATVQSRPWLLVYGAWARVMMGQHAQAEPALRQAQQAAEQGDVIEPRHLLGYIATIAAYRAAVHGQAALAVAEGHKALDLLSPHDALVRCVVAYILGGLHIGSGDFTRAHEACAVASRSARAAGNIHVAVPAAAALAETCLAQGRLREAAEHYQEALTWLDSQGRYPWPVRGRLLLGLGDIRRECNELDGAESLMTEGLAGIERWGNPEALLYGYAAMVRLYLARQDLGRAAGCVEKALRYSQERAVSPMARLELTAAHVQFLLERGAAPEAEALLQQVDQAAESTPYLRERADISRIRLEIALGRPEEATRRLGALAAEAERTGRTGHLLQMQVLAAAALEAQGDRARAIRVLAQCLKAAQPEGYVRLIVDEGARIAAPLAEIYREWRALDMGACVPYIQKLLAVLRTPVAEDLVEPPSGRELDVLRLIAAGCTNQEIAARLFIAESTVKRHISNLYGKLGVTHRTEVLVRARELGLL